MYNIPLGSKYTLHRTLKRLLRYDMIYYSNIIIVYGIAVLVLKRFVLTALLQALFTVTRLATMSERVYVLCGGDLDLVFNYY